MTDEKTTEDLAFPDFPEAPVYSKLQTNERRAILDGHIKQFEQEMAGHYSNLNRLKAMYDSVSDEEQQAAAVGEANNSIAAIETIKTAIAATELERSTL